MRRFGASLIAVLFLLFGSFINAGLLAQNRSHTDPKATTISGSAANLNLTLPMKNGSVRFAVIGDTGSGKKEQYQVGELMARYNQTFPFKFVLMMGDNIYGKETPRDYQEKFENVYRPLLDRDVKFYASLGNHDEPNQRFYKYFNMNGQEYYNFKEGNASFYALNSNYMDSRQVKWLEETLANDTSPWKFCFFHHPPYSSGKKHGSDTDVREVVEPLFLKYGVNVVFNGHDHFYERIKPQKGIYYFISGAGGQLRPGGIKKKSPLTEKSYDSDMHFMLIEVAGDELHFQAISRTGETIDSGVIVNQRKATAPARN